MGLKIIHWSLTNGSGMHRVAESIAAAETVLGHDSRIVNPQVPAEWDVACDADIHVLHTHFPVTMTKRLTKPRKLIYVAHGTPDHVFQSAVEEGSGFPYGFNNTLLQELEWLKRADARVTFWPRHQWLFQRMVDKGTPIHLVPLGVDTAFWKTGASLGKFSGAPSVFTAENAHYIKWPYDIFTAWPAVSDALDEATLHAIYLPKDMHWWFAPLCYANGSAYRAHISPVTFDHAGLRNAFHSVDFVCGLVRYGDFNQLSLQANAAGATTISYVGNEYADYWVHEGDQRVLAAELTEILAGRVTPRTKTPVPDIADTASAMLTIYHGVL